uniref:Uncharacterized protein n=1 Tax=Acrobeloides nanus TaxID=290746 RepID=A0A914C824_9BILA
MRMCLSSYLIRQVHRRSPPNVLIFSCRYDFQLRNFDCQPNKSVIPDMPANKKRPWKNAAFFCAKLK